MSQDFTSGYYGNPGSIKIVGWDGLGGALPRFDVPNKKVAVEPFPVVEKRNEVKSAVIAPINQSALTGLRVVFPSPTYGTGWLVYVRTKLQTGSTYAREIFEVEGKKFILVPEEEVVLVDREPAVP